MNYAPAPEADLLHATFLRRLAEAPSSGSVHGRLGQGAFLVLRLVDLLEYEQPVYADAFHYQQVAAERFCHTLPVTHTETAHLAGIARSAADAFQEQDVRLVLPALLAYAHELEDELRLDEALDVLETVVRVGGDRIGPPDAIAVRLRLARVLRKRSEFDAADRHYEDAATLAAAVGDQRSQFISRLGRAHTLRGRGNLLQAELWLREILAECDLLGDREVQAWAEQDLGVVLSARGQPTEAVGHFWRAFDLNPDDVSRTRALGDLGAMLLMVGDVGAAERALSEVVRRGAPREVLHNALIELLNCASYRRDRVGFERWRERCEVEQDGMPPHILVDFYLKTGIGRARFGQTDRAEALLGTALSIAEQAGLHEFFFRIGRILGGLRDCQEELETGSPAAAEPREQSDAVREVSASLTHLGAGAS
ncbi:MAG TPA: tetratricopeptide repeat protein [Gemmatimonadales bacterium]|nr:tetratricopeptide repeat protein [Gemmatimonadales bacterium]